MEAQGIRTFAAGVPKASGMSIAPGRGARTRIREDLIRAFLRDGRLTPLPSGGSPRKGSTMAEDHGSSVKDDKQYEGLRSKGMSKERAARIANGSGSSRRGSENSGGGSKAQRQKAGRKGGRKSE
ncbi:MAG TPA: hypothetical protein VHB53_10080 [Solirubrobacterales bacterium]|nr:hypothetical protein [Solirubrobacterales bacterium]